jgi:hypothetical protein
VVNISQMSPRGGRGGQILESVEDAKSSAIPAQHKDVCDWRLQGTRLSVAWVGHVAGR